MTNGSFEEQFFRLLEHAPHGSLPDLLGLKLEARTSSLFEASFFQDAFHFRACYLGWKVASLLIDSSGELRTETLSQLTNALRLYPFSLGPKRESDALLYQHILSCLEKISENWPQIRKFSMPLCHKWAEKIIKDTLWPDDVRSLQDAHIRRAVFTAWFTYLRQSIGSCFATAPAILLQKRPEAFLHDLYELLTTGQLKRVVNGQEFAAPMCLSTGSGELDRPILEKEAFALNPSLFAALETVLFFNGKDGFAKRIERVRQAMFQLESIQTPRQVLKDLLLKKIGLTQQEIADEEYLASIQIEPMAVRSGGVFYREPTPRAKLVAEWKKHFERACLAFLNMTQCALLRIWEYTIASFCDLKTEFAKWNLYIGLGMQKEHEGGIADFLYQYLDQKLQAANAQIVSCQQQYEQAVFAMRSIEAIVQRGSDPSKRIEQSADYNLAAHDAQKALEEREFLAKTAEAISRFFADLLAYYDTMLPRYFQEIFDPSVLEADTLLLEDSPAGFRLLYKHGRQDASAWTLVYNEEEYQDALRSFFSAVEREIPTPPILGGEFTSRLTTELIQHVQTPLFLEKAKERAHFFGRISPWNYVSGGTMQNLVQSYHGLSAPLEEKAIFPQSELALLEVLTSLAQENTEPLLMHSPTHAFIFRPDLLSKDAPSQAQANLQFFKSWKMNKEKQEWLITCLSLQLSQVERPLFLHQLQQYPVAKTPLEMRQFFLQMLKAFRSEETAVLMTDSFLYEHARLFSKEEVRQLFSFLQKKLPFLQSDSIIYRDFAFLGIGELHSLIKETALAKMQTSAASVDWDMKILHCMQQAGLVFPHLILFADTNWSDWFFGFVSNGFTNAVELWRLNRTGMKGFPMHGWKKWFSSQNKIPWKILFP